MYSAAKTAAVNVFGGLTHQLPLMSSDKRAVDSLYLMSWMGNLVEYVLEPHMKNGPEKATDDSQLVVMATTRAQWSLSRSGTFACFHAT